MALPKDTHITEVEYLALEHAADIRHEYLDGNVYAMTGASEQHIKVSDSLHVRLYLALEKRPCTVYHSDMRLKVLATRNYFYPDISVVCGERKLAEDEAIATLLNPILIVEVLSPSTELYDRKTKYQQYKQLPSLQDYVLVSQEIPRVECLSRGTGEQWILTQADGLEASLHLPSIDVTLALAEVYEQVSFPDE